MKGRDILIYLSLLFKGDWDKIYTCIKNKTSINDKIASLENEFNSLKENIVTIIDDNYPSIFKIVVFLQCLLFFIIKGICLY